MDLFILLILFFLQTACEHFNGQFQCTLSKAATKVGFPESTNLFSLVTVDATTGKNELLG